VRAHDFAPAFDTAGCDDERSIVIGVSSEATPPAAIRDGKNRSIPSPRARHGTELDMRRGRSARGQDRLPRSRAFVKNLQRWSQTLALLPANGLPSGSSTMNAFKVAPLMQIGATQHRRR
jgi:hypothetical protein